jgi:hypothetical protein
VRIPSSRLILRADTVLFKRSPGRKHALQQRCTTICVLSTSSWAVSLLLSLYTSSEERKIRSGFLFRLDPAVFPLFTTFWTYPRALSRLTGRSTKNCMVRGTVKLHHICDLIESFVGPISSISVLGTTYIIINDTQVCFELLDKRSSIYSNRPIFHYGGELYVFVCRSTFLRRN